MFPSDGQSLGQLMMLLSLEASNSTIPKLGRSQ